MGDIFRLNTLMGPRNTVVVGDGLLRQPRGEICERLTAECPGSAWQETHVGKSGGALCFEFLREYSRK